jgi:lactoylglutathione lyase
MKFLWTTIHVKDMDESLKFYQDIVGLELKRRFNAGPGMELAFLGVGETEIELVCAEHDIHPGNIVGISIGFSIENADDFRKILMDMGLVVSDMIKPNPMMQFFYVKDPNGVNVQFVHDLR